MIPLLWWELVQFFLELSLYLIERYILGTFIYLLYITGFFLPHASPWLFLR